MGFRKKIIIWKHLFFFFQLYENWKSFSKLCPHTAREHFFISARFGATGAAQAGGARTLCASSGATFFLCICGRRHVRMADDRDTKNSKASLSMKEVERKTDSRWSDRCGVGFFLLLFFFSIFVARSSEFWGERDDETWILKRQHGPMS